MKLAVDFVELQRGLILERRMNRDEALIYIRKYAGRLYDPELIEPFIQVCATTLADVTLADPQVRAHGTRDLVPGMVLARNLTANNGMLLLNAGKVLNLALIEKLIAFEAIEGARYTLFVRLPESTTRRLPSDLEALYRRAHGRRNLVQAPGGGGHLVHRLGVLLRTLGDEFHALGDFIAGARLFADGLGNFVDHRRGMTGSIEDLVDRYPSLTSERHPSFTGSRRPPCC